MSVPGHGAAALARAADWIVFRALISPRFSVDQV
jgi:hypothetical protein